MPFWSIFFTTAHQVWTAHSCRTLLKVLILLPLDRLPVAAELLRGLLVGIMLYSTFHCCCVRGDAWVSFVFLQCEFSVFHNLGRVSHGGHGRKYFRRPFIGTSKCGCRFVAAVCRPSAPHQQAPRFWDTARTPRTRRLKSSRKISESPNF